MSDVQQTEREPVSVLLVDDEENILKSIQRLLMDEEDIEITTATSGEEGLKLLPGLTNLGLIVSDQRMPGMGGAQFLEKARDIKPDASRIILTGYADVTAAVDAINKGGAWRYLAKPWNDEELVRVFREGLERFRFTIENRRLNALVLKQNLELEEWNSNLKGRVLEQTTAIRTKNEELHLLLKKVKDDYNSIIAAFSGLVEMHGGRLRQHSRNVAELSVNAARELGIAGDELETIRIAALLHDVGKIGISERILILPQESMNADDSREYRQHPIRGQVAIDTIEDLRPAGLFIRHHHENFDGSGFPDRLAGDAIPLGARIIAYANHVDKAADSCCGDDIASQALVKAGFQAGKLLDPSLQKVFRKVALFTYFSISDPLSQVAGKGAKVASLELETDERGLVERELAPGELESGMLLSQDFRSGSGILLLRRGITLDESTLTAIRRNYRLDAPPHGVYVLMKH